MKMNLFDWVYSILGSGLLLFELYAIYLKNAGKLPHGVGETITSKIYRWMMDGGRKWRRLFVIGGCLWLTYHFGWQGW